MVGQTVDRSQCPLISHCHDCLNSSASFQFVAQ